MGGAGQVRQAKVNLNEILQENELYEDVLDQINRKLALRQAIDKASDAIERSKQGSELGSKYGFDNGSNAARSKASSTSKMSLIALSNKVRQQGQEEIFSNAGMESLGSRSQLRSTAHGLVDNLQI
eukprot:CAMPEP_0185582206 /NCGR_PEP_ID=MMETSP0434-20130131/20155_1 /TAXON_ID=626734 ORGANISM="Favella taraikaensis, Strain Fe Narragansett Bay" /NCGR_SAMPLE_ID=MMETSP0434 /ASSEMBLY_ACC=CAM_ASM_000379 /LENGTH=125 /DNA_ID=CAMNT_0028200969 /DNA_START=462 /DNA_END=839 /DNA_ORIENTATION=+